MYTLTLVAIILEPSRGSHISKLVVYLKFVLKNQILSTTRPLLGELLVKKAIESYYKLKGKHFLKEDSHRKISFGFK